MIDFNVLREYLVQANIVSDSVFLFEKPTQIKCNDYIVYNFKELSGGAVKQYQLDIRVIGKDKLKVLENKDKLIKALDIYDKACKIQDEEMTIRKINLVNGGGLIFNDETNEYNAVCYFKLFV